MDQQFEGGGTTTMNNTSSVAFSNSRQTDSFPRSGEFVLNQETVEPVAVEQAEGQMPTNQELADTIFADAKEKGVTETLEKLARGEYFNQYNGNQDISFEEQQNEQNTLDSPQEEAKGSAEEIAQEDEHPETEGIETTPSIFDATREYLAAEMSTDPEYQQKLGEVLQEKIENGEDINPNALKQEAVQRLIDERNKEFSKLPLNEKFDYLQREYSKILDENQALKSELEAVKHLAQQQSEAFASLSQAILELAKNLHQDEDDEKKKVSLLEILVTLMGWLLQEAVKVEEKNGQAKQAHNGKAGRKTTVQLPTISFGSGSKKKQPTEELAAAVVPNATKAQKSAK